MKRQNKIVPGRFGCHPAHRIQQRCHRDRLGQHFISTAFHTAGGEIGRGVRSAFNQDMVDLPQISAGGIGVLHEDRDARCGQVAFNELLEMERSEHRQRLERHAYQCVCFAIATSAPIAAELTDKAIVLREAALTSGDRQERTSMASIKI